MHRFSYDVYGLYSVTFDLDSPVLGVGDGRQFITCKSIISTGWDIEAQPFNGIEFMASPTFSNGKSMGNMPWSSSDVMEHAKYAEITAKLVDALNSILWLDSLTSEAVCEQFYDDATRDIRRIMDEFLWKNSPTLPIVKRIIADGPYDESDYDIGGLVRSLDDYMHGNNLNDFNEIPDKIVDDSLYFFCLSFHD